MPTSMVRTGLSGATLRHDNRECAYRRGHTRGAVHGVSKAASYIRELNEQVVMAHEVL